MTVAVFRPASGAVLPWRMLALLTATVVFVSLSASRTAAMRRTADDPDRSKAAWMEPLKGNPYTNTVGMKFVWISPGKFLMGSPDGTNPRNVPEEAQRLQEEKPHGVTLTRGYHMGVHLVTQYQWEQVMGAEKANHSAFKGKDDEDRKKLPVDNVSWYDCVEFCNKLSVREGRKPRYRLANEKREGDRITAADVEIVADANGYRLPSEAQWEYACRAGTETAFWWGDSITTDQANYDGAIATYGPEGKKGEYRKKTTPVGDFKANPWGLHDMHGNLYQWCEDWYGPYGEGDKKDPLKLDKGDAAARVMRGGSWDSVPRWCRAAHRFRMAPDPRNSVHGCRVVLCPD
jgi:formylglycine-generating enzyme required for sulfatase activity